jgi:hypothetical protein
LVSAVRFHAPDSLLNAEEVFLLQTVWMRL